MLRKSLERVTENTTVHFNHPNVTQAVSFYAWSISSFHTVHRKFTCFPHTLPETQTTYDKQTAAHTEATSFISFFEKEWTSFLRATLDVLRQGERVKHIRYNNTPVAAVHKKNVYKLLSVAYKHIMSVLGPTLESLSFDPGYSTIDLVHVLCAIPLLHIYAQTDNTTARRIAATLTRRLHSHELSTHPQTRTKALEMALKEMSSDITERILTYCLQY